MRSMLFSMTYEQRIRQELQRVEGTDEWICIHSTPSEPDAFEVGRVMRVGSEAVLLDSVDSKGRNNGSRSIEFEIIRGLTIGGSYIASLRLLRETLPPPRYIDVAEPTPEGTLRAAQAEGLAVNVRLAEETVGGFVCEVGEEWVAIDQIDGDTGEDEGLRIVSLDDLERVFVGGEDEMRLTALARARQLADEIG